LTDASGAVVDRFQYSAFAQLVNHEGSSDTPFLYNGRDGVMSDASGLYYMRARFYSPSIRRFVNQDVLLGTVVNGQSLNRFAFVNGNPVSFVDPDGQVPIVVVPFIVWGVIEVALSAYDIYNTCRHVFLET
jgi:RHS repeat-associated protein